MKPAPIEMRLDNLLERIERPETVDASKEYRLLGVRLDGAGPFLREVKLGSELSAKKLFMVKKDDFIYSRLFAWRGAFGVIETSQDGCYVSNEFPIFRPKDNKVDVDFLKYWFRLRRVLDKVESDCSGSTPLTRNRYKEEFFLSLRISLPPLSEQRRIVAKIEYLAAKIAETQSLRLQSTNESEKLVNSYTHQLFKQNESRNCTFRQSV